MLGAEHRKAKTKSRRRRCPYCGSWFVLTQGRDCCAECDRIAREAGATPRAWDRAFDDRLACLLMSRFGEWVHVGRELGASSEDVKWSVRLLRRHGFVVDGDQRRGYRLTGWHRWPEHAPAPSAPTE